MREFSGRVAVIATMHHKEQAIAPVLEAALGVTVQVPPHFDTDRFGTFTRDVPRVSDQLETARLKAQAALELTGETLAIASEGSFGPCPDMPLLPCNRELVVLIDQTHELQIVGQITSRETNFRSQSIDTIEEAIAFARSVGFPRHGLVVMPTSEGPATVTTKGITTETELKAAIALALSQATTPQVHIETDMRALYNPSRMSVIAQATQDLVAAVERRCPNCGCPGFSITQRRPGLPCELCGTPTLLTLSVRYRCQRCQFQQDKPSPDQRQFADPAQCSYCNP